MLVGYHDEYDGYSSSYMESDPDNYRDAHVAIAISEGECEGIRGIYLDDIYFRLTKVSTNSDGSFTYAHVDRVSPYASVDGSLFEVIACFGATGTQGASYRAAAGLSSTVKFMDGISWIHLILRQPANADDRVIKWKSFPEVEFIVRGIKVKDPTSSVDTKRWTRSASDLRYWFMTQIQKIAESDIDNNSVNEAATICNATIMTQLDGSYWRYADEPNPPNVDPTGWGILPPAPTVAEPIVWAARAISFSDIFDLNDGEWDVNPWRVRKGDGTVETLFELDASFRSLAVRYKPAGVGYIDDRYTFNGLITSKQKFSDISDEMDFAWQGKVVPGPDGKYYFRPGTDLATRFEWDAASALERSCSVGPALNENANAISSSIEQSRVHDYKSHDLPVIKDDAEITRDGFQKNIRMRSATLVDHPITAGRLQAIFLRLARQNVVYKYRIKNSDATTVSGIVSSAPLWQTVKALDVVTITDIFYGVVARRMVVIDVLWSANASIEVTLVDAPIGAFADTIDIPDTIDDRPVVINPVQVPTGLIGEVETEILSDGSTRPNIKVTWDSARYPAQIRWRVKSIDEDTFVGRVLPLWGKVDDMATVSYWQQADVLGANSLTIRENLDWNLIFELQARLVGPRHEGAWSDPIEVTTLDNIVEVPSNITAVLLNKILLQADAPVRRDIASIEVAVGTSALDDITFPDKSKSYPVTPKEPISILVEEVYNPTGFDISIVPTTGFLDARLVDQFTPADTIVQARFVTKSGATSQLVSATVSSGSANIRVPPDGHVNLVTSTPSDSMAGIRGRIFVRAVQNQAPFWGTIPDIDLRLSSTSSVALQNYLSDPDDPLSVLTITASSSDTTKATINVNGTILTVASGSSTGTSTITVTATDPDGGTTSTTFTVNVNNILGAPTGFSAVGGDGLVSLSWTRPSGIYAKTQYRKKVDT